MSEIRSGAPSLIRSDLATCGEEILLSAGGALVPCVSEANWSQYRCPLLRGYTFYQMNNLDSRIQNADHLLTNDVNQFSQGLVDLYSNLSKPVLDIVLYVQRLTATLGYQVSLLDWEPASTTLVIVSNRS